VNYYCNDGYVLVGSQSRKCLNGGKWNGALPTCRGDYSMLMGVVYLLVCSMIMFVGQLANQVELLTCTCSSVWR